MNLITRGFGALQRIITRGFFSDAPPSPDCYIGFIGVIESPDTSKAGFVGRISSANGFNGAIDATNAGFSGTISGINGFKGDVC
ncbi:hypothetical protein [Pseudoalteromonas sp.]|uniref:hypothetical protein n=1 Tax=Pseudoalteromonas sp. TaxID=53249 RepID=UPI0035632AAA